MTSIADGSVIIPTGSRVCSLDALLVRRSRADGGVSSQARSPDKDQRAGALCAAALRTLRGCDMKSFPCLSQRRKS